MRVVQFHEFGGIQALRLEEVESPIPGAGELLVQVNAVGLNFFDTLMLRDKYQVTPTLPFSPGAEIAGVIEAVGEGVTAFSPGQRVAAFIGGNGCREKIVTDAANAVLIPDEVSDDVAAGIIITYGTALHGLKDRGALQPGERVAITGAAGGAGVAAIETAKLMGGHVIAVASSEDKLAFAKAHGADEGLNYADVDLKRALKDMTKPGGLDVLYDCVGGDAAEPCLRAMGWGGRYLVIGFASGEIPRLPLNVIMLKGCAVIGVLWTAFAAREPETHRANTAQLLAWCKDGKIDPHIHETFALADTWKALGMIQDRKVTGKVIVHPQD